MSDTEEIPDVEAPVEDDVPQDLMSALKDVLKRARTHDGLAIGLHQACKALDKRAAHLCVLAEDCSDATYTRLVEALCAEHGIDLIKVPEKKKLGEWVGLGKYDSAHNLRKVVGNSCCVVKDYGEKSKALDMILEHFKKE
eukprot:NODE_10566_length_586_cov_317.131749_g10289_i0.p1 GENE.NODE_10566_length_586_cov_317.131749_g10289_i0~~NODE_10566_length_586_cov_317.131749_g10289_i0.p1  ORF type:complete len:160 (+),score=58.75 NODE_10566_length_586_cov_317.131749_g10289_i0:62-481(+)